MMNRGKIKIEKRYNCQCISCGIHLSKGEKSIADLEAKIMQADWIESEDGFLCNICKQAKKEPKKWATKKFIAEKNGQKKEFINLLYIANHYNLPKKDIYRGNYPRIINGVKIDLIK